MKAWRLKEPGLVVLDEMESQPVGDNCVKVKIMYCPLSASDRLLVSGAIMTEYPFILGRGASGMVVEAGADVKNLARGDMVAIKPHCACGVCIKCADGKFSECENPFTFGVTEDGLLRDFAVVSARDVAKLPERVGAREAVFIDLIDIAIETINRLKLDKGQYLVITGATELGIIMAQVAIYYQIIPILADINPAFLEIASGLGVYYTINSADIDAKKRIFALTGGRMADAAAYITAADYPINVVFDYVKRGAGIAVCGFERTRAETSVNFASVLNKRLKIMGVAEGNNNFGSAINMLAGHSVDVAPLIGSEINFDQAGSELLRKADTQMQYLKTLVKI